MKKARISLWRLLANSVTDRLSVGTQCPMMAMSQEQTSAISLKLLQPEGGTQGVMIHVIHPPIQLCVCVCVCVCARVCAALAFALIIAGLPHTGQMAVRCSSLPNTHMFFYVHTHTHTHTQRHTQQTQTHPTTQHSTVATSVHELCHHHCTVPEA